MASYDFSIVPNSINTVTIFDGAATPPRNTDPLRSIQGPVNIEVFQPTASPTTPILYIKLRELVVFQFKKTEAHTVAGVNVTAFTLPNLVMALTNLFELAQQPV